MLPDGLLEMIEAEYVLAGRLDPQGLLQYVQIVEEDGTKYAVIDPHYEDWVKYLPERFHAPDKSGFTPLAQARNWMWRQIQELIEDTELYHFTNGENEYISYRLPEELDGATLLEWFRAEKEIMKILVRVPEEIRMSSYYF
jgi:hypothetical protein